MVKFEFVLDDAEAEALMSLIKEEIFRLKNADLCMEPFFRQQCEIDMLKKHSEFVKVIYNKMLETNKRV